MGRHGNDRSLDDFANLALVAPTLKVLYLPTPKAACTTLKLLLAEAAGTHRPEMANRLAIMHVSRAQTIHHPAVHGLTRFADLPSRERRAILGSDDWLRLASLRDPVSRAYSAWENRIFMRAHRRSKELLALVEDVTTDGRVDLAASFARFVAALGANQALFMTDHHFWPQSRIVRHDLVEFTRLVRVDKAGEIDVVAAMLSERSGTTIAASRLNEGLGVRAERVCDRATADRLMTTYRDDYDRLGFERREWPASVEPLCLGEMESRLLTSYRNVFERGISVARESQRRTGARYGVSQMHRAIIRSLRGSTVRDPKEIQP